MAASIERGPGYARPLYVDPRQHHPSGPLDGAANPKPAATPRRRCPAGRGTRRDGNPTPGPDQGPGIRDHVVRRRLAPGRRSLGRVTVLTGSFTDTSWRLIAAAVVLGCLGKGLGGYLGARRGGRPPRTARRVAVLMNTRGLTELIVLQAGLSSGILTGPIVLALIVMALTTTAMTGPLLTLLDRAERRPTTAAYAVATESRVR